MTIHVHGKYKAIIHCGDLAHTMVAIWCHHLQTESSCTKTVAKSYKLHVVS